MHHVQQHTRVYTPHAALKTLKKMHWSVVTDNQMFNPVNNLYIRDQRRGGGGGAGTVKLYKMEATKAVWVRDYVKFPF